MQYNTIQTLMKESMSCTVNYYLFIFFFYKTMYVFYRQFFAKINVNSAEFLFPIKRLFSFRKNKRENFCRKAVLSLE